ncbi:MAG: fluoride efflux transporter CrcB [Turneriella sp.]|nr:fluoride efflux transporter CrcB [Leptospiraceae bacterium]MCX7633009.1 fluoride efflux transporter CrcB [Turneriella sp.]
MLTNIVLVAIGGLVGSVLRYLVSLFVVEPGAFPLRTFLVNVVGSFLMGILFALSEKNLLPTQGRLLLMTGLCGGFTTFSAFSLENLQLLQSGEFSALLLYVVASVLLGLLALAAGSYAVLICF